MDFLSFFFLSMKCGGKWGEVETGNEVVEEVERDDYFVFRNSDFFENVYDFKFENDINFVLFLFGL